MKRILLLAISVALANAEKVEILRDEFGVAHIFAATPAGAAYASGYAQASDRLGEMMRNFRKAEGTMAEAFGPEWFRHDHRQRMWRHRQVAEQNFHQLSPQVRAIIEAFVAGVKQYMKEHPQNVPEWAIQLEPWHVVALGRFTIWRWPEGEASGDLARAGIPQDPAPYTGSNQWLIAPWRTAVKAPIAVIDPHLSWYGETRYYEMRLYAGEWAYSGAVRVGLPFPTLGHSRYASIAMTTGGPDTSDVFEEEVSEGRYKLKGEWRPLQVRREKIGVKTVGKVDWKEAVYEYTHHGPVVAHKEGKAYSMATPYAEEFRLVEQAWAMVTSKNLAEMKKALAMRQYMAQNIMVGTVDGDTYYVRNGRVPIRPKGCDPSRPQPGAVLPPPPIWPTGWCAPCACRFGVRTM
jgi:acyl-homoserine-lactone acylase